MKLPGVIWSALLVALPLLAMWLEQYFPGAVWAAPVSGLILIVVQTISVFVQQPVGEQPPGVNNEAFVPEPEPSKTQRWLWGK